MNNKQLANYLRVKEFNSAEQLNSFLKEHSFLKVLDIKYSTSIGPVDDRNGIDFDGTTWMTIQPRILVIFEVDNQEDRNDFDLLKDGD